MTLLHSAFSRCTKKPVPDFKGRYDGPDHPGQNRGMTPGAFLEQYGWTSYRDLSFPATGIYRTLASLWRSLHSKDRLGVRNALAFVEGTVLDARKHMAGTLSWSNIAARQNYCGTARFQEVVQQSCYHS